MCVPGKKKRTPVLWELLRIRSEKRPPPVLQHSTHWDASSLKYFFIQILTVLFSIINKQRKQFYFLKSRKRNSFKHSILSFT